MTKLKKYSLKGKEVGTVTVDKRLADATCNEQLIKDYTVAIRHNLRQWSANTKTRKEVNYSTKKIRPQKGTGGARHGARSAPQFKGGGVVFGPKPKFDQHVRINKKERRSAIRAILSQRIRDEKVCLIESTEMEAPKTKTVSEFLNKVGFDRNILFLGEGASAEVENKQIAVKQPKHDTFYRSLRNLPQADFCLVKNINGFDLLRSHALVMTEEALNEIIEWLC